MSEIILCVILVSLWNWGIREGISGGTPGTILILGGIRRNSRRNSLMNLGEILRRISDGIPDGIPKKTSGGIAEEILGEILEEILGGVPERSPDTKNSFGNQRGIFLKESLIEFPAEFMKQSQKEFLKSSWGGLLKEKKS